MMHTECLLFDWSIVHDCASLPELNVLCLVWILLLNRSIRLWLSSGWIWLITRQRRLFQGSSEASCHRQCLAYACSCLAANIRQRFKQTLLETGFEFILQCHPQTKPFQETQDASFYACIHAESMLMHFLLHDLRTEQKIQVEYELAKTISRSKPEFLYKPFYDYIQGCTKYSETSSHEKYHLRTNKSRPNPSSISYKIILHPVQ